MKTLYLERSVSSGRNGAWVEELDLEGVERIVVGTGPGSFAGIRSALAFAQGYALGKNCEVLGLPSPCACAAQVFASQFATFNLQPSTFNFHLAVLGDARQGMIWVALFNGYSLEKDIFQVKIASETGTVPSEIMGTVPEDCCVVTPDEVRIGGLLREMFGDRYLGGQTPTVEGLRLFAEANPQILKSEPLPIYLNPAVRHI